MTFKKTLTSFIIITTMLINGCGSPKSLRPQTPTMGWSSWNNFRVNINEEIISGQADAIISNGMKDAGYNFINIDDGYFGTRDEDGGMQPNPEKFPNGMKTVVDYIHSKGLKAGIYTEAGADTCGSKWDDDKFGFGAGLYQHEEQDLTRMLQEWGFDFIKIDFCGARWIGMKPQPRYTEISKMIRKIKPEAVFLLSRGKFFGVWETEVADSWRISFDNRAKFDMILTIIEDGVDMWPYAGPGHVNNMDMLQVGRGMTYEEDKTHFSMWCMMCSPLMAGNDLRYMSEQTLEILTNVEIIALNQDPLVYQARRIRVDKDYDLKEDFNVWAKPLGSVDSGKVAIALMNRKDEEREIRFTLEELGLDSSAEFTIRDLWAHEDLIGMDPDKLVFTVAPHGVVVLKVEGEMTKLNPFVFPLQ